MNFHQSGTPSSGMPNGPVTILCYLRLGSQGGSERYLCSMLTVVVEEDCVKECVCCTKDGTQPCVKAEATVLGLKPGRPITQFPVHREYPLAQDVPFDLLELEDLY